MEITELWGAPFNVVLVVFIMATMLSAGFALTVPRCGGGTTRI